MEHSSVAGSLSSRAAASSVAPIVELSGLPASLHHDAHRTPATSNVPPNPPRNPSTAVLRKPLTMRTLLLLSVFAALGLAGGAAAQNPMLFATVGPGFSIKLAPDPSGGRILQIPPGTYTIKVSDLSPEHSFHLSGPGVDMATSVEGTGTAIWTITFQEGTYHFECDAHPTTMKGDFTVVAGAHSRRHRRPRPPSARPPPARPKPLSLAGAVGPGATISRAPPARRSSR